MSGRLAVPKTLEIKGKIPTEAISHLFSRAIRKDFPFFLWRDPLQNRPKTQPLQVALLLLERVLGEENCLGKGGVDMAKKGKKDAQKKKGGGFCVTPRPSP